VGRSTHNVISVDLDRKVKELWEQWGELKQQIEQEKDEKTLILLERRMDSTDRLIHLMYQTGFSETMSVEDLKELREDVFRRMNQVRKIWEVR